MARLAVTVDRFDLSWDRNAKQKIEETKGQVFPERQTVVPPSEAPQVGVAFFGRELYDQYYSGPKVLIGAPDGRPVFFMPLEDASYIKSPRDAARHTGMSPSTEQAYRNETDVLGETEIFGIIFPTEGMSVSEPSHVDANQWPHYVEGGNTAVRTEGPNGGYLVNSVREFIVPSGKPAPSGSKLFKLGPNGERIILKVFP